MNRLADAWRAMEPEQRLAALVSGGLFISMFLPWYSNTGTVVEHGAAKAAQVSLTAFQAFSFVEAAVLLVSAGVLAMLFARVEQRNFELPGGDGLIVMIAGGWTSLLIFYRLIDKPGLKASQRLTATVGVEWGIFIALLLAVGLIYAGARMRASEQSSRSAARQARLAGSAPPRDPSPHTVPREPETPGEPETGWAAPEESVTIVPATAHAARSRPVPDEPRSGATRPRYPPAPAEQMSFEDPAPGSE
jgi:hypothetical protein